MKETVLVFLKGGVIGIANIIPGVSGGTMALVLGIYERLLHAITSISSETLIVSFKALSLKKHHRKVFIDEMKRIDFPFLVLIALGALGAIVALAQLMTWLLTEFHDPTYGFFFGLVLVSVAAPYREIKQKGIAVLLAVIVGTAGVIAISEAAGGDRLIEKAKVKQEMSAHPQPEHSSDTIVNTIIIFLSGALAISAMILPGVSGSLLLLLLGSYFEVLKAIAEKNLVLLGIFALGCIVGAAFFTRFLSWLLEKSHNVTMGVLTGLVAGSLWMIWPFKKHQLIGTEKVYLNNILPEVLGINEIVTVATLALGAVLVLAMMKLEGKRHS